MYFPRAHDLHAEDYMRRVYESAGVAYGVWAFLYWACTAPTCDCGRADHLPNNCPWHYEMSLWDR